MKKKYTVFCILFFWVLCAASCSKKLVKVQMNEEAIRNVGEAYLVEKKYTAALKEFLKAEKIYSEDPFLQNDIGLAYMAKGNTKLAIIHFKKAISIDFSYAPALNNLGTAYMAMGSWDDAISCFKNVLEDMLYSTPHYSLSNLGWAHYNKNHYRIAKKYYTKALEIEPDFIQALHGLGLTYIATGQFLQAVKKLEKAVQILPNFAKLHFDLANAYVLEHDYEKARKAYNTVVKLAPNSIVAKKARIKLEKSLFKNKGGVKR